MTHDRDSSRRRLLGAALALLSAPAARLVSAQESYPSKAVRLLVPATVGGGTDAIARVWANSAAEMLKQAVTVENRGGASGMIASEALAHSAPDGHALIIVQNAHAMNPSMFKKVPYDTLRDFTPVATLARSWLVLVAAASTGVNTMADLVAFAKRQPDGVSFGSAEASIQLASEQIRSATGITMTLVSYKGTGPMVTDVVGGHLPFAVTTIASMLPHRNAGKLNVVGILAPQRSPLLTDVPTLAEQGYAGINASAWWGLVGPGNLPPAIVQKLNALTGAILAQPEVKTKLTAFGVEPWIEPPENFDRFIRTELALTAQLAKRAGIVPE